MSDEITCEHIAEQPKPEKIVWVSSKPWKPKKSKKNTGSFITSAISLLVAGLALLFSIRPTLIPGNINYEQRAQAGDINTQMFLGNYFYQIGNIENSILYYSMVLARSRPKNLDTRRCICIASNNLGYLYATEIKDFDTARSYWCRGLDKMAQDEDLRYRYMSSLAYNFVVSLSASVSSFRLDWARTEYPFLAEYDKYTTNIFKTARIILDETERELHNELYEKNSTYRFLYNYRIVNNLEEYSQWTYGDLDFPEYKFIWHFTSYK